MIYFVTGASGFIGKRLVRALLARSDATVYFLMRRPTEERVGALHAFWGVDGARAIPVRGDLTEPALGISADDTALLAGKVDHVFHLAAVYDLEADPQVEMTANVEGTRNTSASPRRSRPSTSTTSPRSPPPASTTGCSARTCSPRRPASITPISPASIRRRR